MKKALPIKLNFKTILSTLFDNKLLIKKMIRPEDLNNTFFEINYEDDKAHGQSAFLLFNPVKRDNKTRIPELLKKGVSFFILEDESLCSLLQENCSYILASCVRSAWARLCSVYFNHPEKNLKLVAITGTNGKSTTAWVLNELLNSIGEKSGYIGTLGNTISDEIEFPHTTPDPPVLFSLFAEAKKKGISYVILEASSHAIVQNKLEGLIFSACLFTSFGRDHLDFHKDLENYLNAKLSLFSKNYTNEKTVKLFHTSLLEVIERKKLQNEGVLFYGSYESFSSKNLEDIFSYRLLFESLKGSQLQLKLKDQVKTYKSPYFGSFNHENLCGAFASCLTLTGKIPEEASLSLSQIPGRFERIEAKNKEQPSVFIDFAHTPEALEKALLELKKLKKDGKLYLVFGCGGNRDKEKRPLMGCVAEKNSDCVVLTSDNSRFENPSDIIKDILAGIKNKDSVQVIENREKAILETLKKLHPTDTLLLAGKGHENYQDTHGTKTPFSEVSIVKSFFEKTSQ